MKQKLTDEIRNRLAKQLGVSVLEIADDADLAEDLQTDSLDIVEFVTGMEDHYEIVVSDEELMTWKTVEAISKSVYGLLQGKSGH